MSTGDLEGLHSSGKGFGMDGTDEEKDSTAFDLQKKKQKTRSANNLSVQAIKDEVVF